MPEPLNILCITTPSLPQVLWDRMRRLGNLRFACQLSGEELKQAEEECDIAVSSARMKIDASRLDRMPRCRMIGSVGAGFDGYDIAEIRSRGIKISNTPGVLSDDVADHAVCMMLDVAKQVTWGDRFLRAGAWIQKDLMPLGRSVTGKRVGIAGLGRIGQKIAKRAAAFSMEIGYTSHRKKNNPWRRFDSTRELAAWADFLVIALPGSPETCHLVDAEVLEALGPQGFLINVGRGTVIDTEALVSALRGKKIAGAGLDVFEDEPWTENELTSFQNVVLTPHSATATVETREKMANLCADNIEAFLAGEALITPVPGS